MTDREPLHGIRAMAAYYIEILQAVQSEGPYDLGGYSLGGVLAYEVTRQLQELGRTVRTIVMLDSFSSHAVKNVKISQKTGMLSVVNMALLATILHESEKFVQTLIHRDDVNAEADDEAFLKQLIRLATARGLSKTEAQIDALIQQNAKVQRAYDIPNHVVSPLPDPQAVTCYYFRNKNGVFLGALEPYFALASDDYALDHVNYWEEWERQLPKFHLMDVDASNHMMLLLEPNVYDTITAFCERVYSEKGISPQFLGAFKRKTKHIHGSMSMKAVKKTASEEPVKKAVKKKITKKIDK